MSECSSGKCTSSVAKTKSGQVIEESNDSSIIGFLTEEEIKSTAVFGKVGLGCGVTKNIGNYESVRADVSVELPFVPTSKDNLDAAFKKAEEVANEKIQQILIAALGAD